MVGLGMPLHTLPSVARCLFAVLFKRGGQCPVEVSRRGALHFLELLSEAMCSELPSKRCILVTSPLQDALFASQEKFFQELFDSELASQATAEFEKAMKELAEEEPHLVEQFQKLSEAAGRVGEKGALDN